MFRLLTSIAMILCLSVPLGAQKKGMNSITAADLKFHLDFIASDEFEGRDTPSTGLKIASRYVAMMAEKYGFKPLMPDGSYFQNIPLEISKISDARTYIQVEDKYGERIFRFPRALGIPGRSVPEGVYSGGIVFVGFGLENPNIGWDDYAGIDCEGKIVVMLDGTITPQHVLSQLEHQRALRRRYNAARAKGAVAVLTVVSEEREEGFERNGWFFDDSERGSLVEPMVTRPRAAQSAQARPFLRAEIRHEVAAALLDVSRYELSEMFAALQNGLQVPSRNMPGKNVVVSVGAMKNIGHTQNVVAWLEGRDSKLKNEYVVIGSHTDHVGAREGMVFNGADDNGSGTVGMLEIAEAMSIDRPKRSVIMVWHTGEEKGLWGAHYFVNNCPVPVEKISANINLDMLCRNDPNSIYLIGSKYLSTELDASLQKMNNKYTKLFLDYTYEDPSHPDRFFYRSDQYPYILFGIPGVWIFCGTTEDYHQPTDTVDRVDYEKMEKVTRLAYLAGYEIANMKNMLKLDVIPEISTRGAHNLKYRR